MTGRIGHSWRSTTAPAEELSRAVCDRCKAARRITRESMRIEFSRDGVTWGDHVACEPKAVQP